MEHRAKNGGRLYVRKVDGVIEILGKSGKKKDQFINKLTTSDIIRRINYIKFDEKFKNI